jgi:hypothetical protein
MGARNCKEGQVERAGWLAGTFLSPPILPARPLSLLDIFWWTAYDVTEKKSRLDKNVTRKNRRMIIYAILARTIFVNSIAYIFSDYKR